MFYIMENFIYLQVRPEFLGPQYVEHIHYLLKQKVEGTVVENTGLVLAVENSVAMDSGKLQEGTGLILVPMRYTAFCIQIFKNEVVDCEVVEVNKLGFFAELGPVRIFVSKSSMPKGWKYTEQDLHAMGPAYVSEKGDQSIRLEAAVRVRLIATRMEAERMLAVGTIDGEYLGPRILG
mmetsp:Transcript_59632/g.108704  ORF Transcript_59632/g.108704 Transcript_59632/m.108704 type:complete len:178 (-) Transcript_59632:14-547(-)